MDGKQDRGQVRVQVQVEGVARLTVWVKQWRVEGHCEGVERVVGGLVSAVLDARASQLGGDGQKLMSQIC